MLEAEKKYFDNAFKHLDKQNRAILAALGAIMTQDQHKKAQDYLKRLNTRADFDLEKLKSFFPKKP